MSLRSNDALKYSSILGRPEPPPTAAEVLSRFWVAWCLGRDRRFTASSDAARGRPSTDQPEWPLLERLLNPDVVLKNDGSTDTWPMGQANGGLWVAPERFNRDPRFSALGPRDRRRLFYEGKPIWNKLAHFLCSSRPDMFGDWESSQGLAPSDRLHPAERAILDRLSVEEDRALPFRGAPVIGYKGGSGLVYVSLRRLDRRVLPSHADTGHFERVSRPESSAATLAPGILAASDLRAFSTFYGSTFPCVATGLPNGTPYGPISLTRSSWMSYVPLLWSAADILVRLGRDAPRMLLADRLLSPTALLRRADAHFAAGDTPLAYGAARLAASIWSQAAEGDAVGHELQAAADAFFYARHRVAYPLLADLLTCHVVPRLSRQYWTEAARAAWLQEIAGLYGEHGEAAHATPLYTVLATLQRGPVSLAKEISRLRREGLTQSVLGGRTGTALLEEAQLLVGNKLLATPGTLNSALSVANARAWLFMQEGNWRGTRQVLEPFKDLLQGFIDEALSEGVVRPGVTSWNFGELLHGLGIATGRHEGRKRDELLRAAGRVIQEAGARMFWVRPGALSVAYKHVHTSRSLQDFRRVADRRPLPPDLERQLTPVVSFLMRTGRKT